MILNELVLNNFRVFRGEHRLDLAPRVRYGRKRPVVLFGGLNGAGKTSILSAIRLVLYGKQALGNNVSTKEYTQYLLRSIHRAPSEESVQANAANVQLAFSYGAMGVLKHYVVKRSWQSKGDGVAEALTVVEDGQRLSDLSAEQCQGFLNELIPIGVSDLFFFDGEKIAELAEDAKGDALGDSIKKLLGLDLLETLDADLGILLRNESKKAGAARQQQHIHDLEEQLNARKGEAAEELTAFEQLEPKILELNAELAKLETNLSARGGAWAATREEEIRKQSALSEERKQIEASLREALGGTFPFALAPTFTARTLQQLQAESAQRHTESVAAILRDRLTSFRRRVGRSFASDLQEELDAALEAEFSEFISPKRDAEIIHDISERALGQVEAVLGEALNGQRKHVAALSSRLKQVVQDLDRAGKQIARAPEEERIKPLIERISTVHEERAAARSAQRTHLENHKRLLIEALSLARELERESSRLVSDQTRGRMTEYAESARSLLREFSARMAERKIRDLENEFVRSFHRLARKDDIDLRASIDPRNFSVSLRRANGVEVEKDELSAGEKQIYAISILEALARTSGRHLPVIIDTPLGRLDSVHRGKLINEYFPSASHQVIILSTDTEVDEEFYSDLSSSISHAFKLEYASADGCTTAREGYFWRAPRKKGELSNVAESSNAF